MASKTGKRAKPTKPGPRRGWWCRTHGCLTTYLYAIHTRCICGLGRKKPCDLRELREVGR